MFYCCNNFDRINIKNIAIKKMNSNIELKKTRRLNSLHDFRHRTTI